MGNNSSSWFSIKTLEEEEAEKVKRNEEQIAKKQKLLNSLSQYDITMNTIKHENMFKGTITICIVYAVFGFILLLLSYFSAAIRDLLFNKFLSFTLIYIIGSIIIIFIMLYYIYTFEPVKIDRYNDIDEISCPDYWKVEIIDDNYIGNSFDSNYSNEFKYRCVLNEEIFDKEEMFKYHNKKNYRMTNNFSNLDYENNKNGKFRSDRETSFNDNYKNNSNLYNIYVDVNNYSVHSNGDITTFDENKKDLAKQLKIYNDNTRVEKIYSNLRNIALLENNYEIDSLTSNASYLLNRSNILNPNINFNTFKNNNVGIGVTYSLDYTNAMANGLKIINWNGLTNDILNRYFTDENVKALKVVVTKNPSINNHFCLGLIRKKYDDDIDEDNVNDNTATDKIDLTKFKYYYYPRQDTTFIETIFLSNNKSTLVKDSDIDLDNKIFINTKLFKCIITNEEKFEDYNDIVASQSGNITYEYIHIDGPYIQAYNKNSYNKDLYTATDIHNNKNVSNATVAPLLCDTLYPKLFAKFESYDINNENHNDIRCAYSKICGIPWSDLRCPSN
jgi:hypothetical protein